MAERVAVFLDRDGTLTHPRHYPSQPEDLVPYDEVVAPLRELRRRGVLLVLVTNQSGLARGYFTQREFDVAQASLEERLRAAGVWFDAVYHCPHHPDGTVAGLAVRCLCRKPEPGMLRRAAAEHGIDLARSWMVGDFPTDVAAGRRAGCRTVLVARDEKARSDGAVEAPDHTASGTAQALRHVLRELDDGRPWNGRRSETVLDRVDTDRIHAMAQTVRRTTTWAALQTLLGPAADPGLLQEVAEVCSLDHGGLLVFPRRIDGVAEELLALGFRTGPLTPSVVVKSRICGRYGLDPDRTDIMLAHASVPGAGRRQIEVFMLGPTDGLDERAVAQERALGLENHLAFRVTEPQAVEVLTGAFRAVGGFNPDGSGFNPHEETDGVSVQYFARVAQDASGQPVLTRVELTFAGPLPARTGSPRDTGVALRTFYATLWGGARAEGART